MLTCAKLSFTFYLKLFSYVRFPAVKRKKNEFSDRWKVFHSTVRLLQDMKPFIGCLYHDLWNMYFTQLKRISTAWLKYLKAFDVFFSRSLVVIRRNEMVPFVWKEKFSSILLYDSAPVIENGSWIFMFRIMAYNPVYLMTVFVICIMYIIQWANWNH